MCDPMPQHGVTTVLMGNCSLSLAPVRPEHRQQIRTVFCYVEDVHGVSFDQSVPWSWETYDEFRQSSVPAGTGSTSEGSSATRRSGCG